MTAKRVTSYADSAARHDEASAPEQARRLQPLFLASAAIRGAVALLFVSEALYVLGLLGISDLVAWLVLGLTSAGLAIVLLDDALDLEGKVAEQAARVAVYEPDRHGARSEAVRAYAEDTLRLTGRIPAARVSLRQPDTGEVFRAYFPSRRADCKRWLANALVGCVHSALRLTALSLLIVVGVQLYFLSAA
jgi:hypothetical protein